MRIRLSKLTKAVVILLSAILALKALTSIQSVSAQNSDSWQDSATGLSINQNNTQKTAGLGFNVLAQDWPFLSLRGGVEADPSISFELLDIELGQIKVPGSSGAFSNETVDWAHNELTFSYGGSSTLNIWVSRLSPAIAVQADSDTLDLFSGNVSRYSFDGSNVTSQPLGPSLLKYLAYSSNGGNIQVNSLSSSPTSLSTLDQNWILLWYGDNSHYVETKVPLEAINNAYQADAPFLIVFENKPVSINQASEGGVTLSFSGPSGYITILPLFGRDLPQVSDTETWSNGLPNNVLQKAQWWADRLCFYPVGARETYAYDELADQVSIAESINSIVVCSGGTQFAPIPPMLGIAKDSLGVSFSDTVVDGGLNTDFGPSLGIENTQTYSWNVNALKKYTDAKRILVNAGQAPTELVAELSNEIQKIIASGHLAPWLFIDDVPWHIQRGALYWGNPADSLYHLTEVAEAISNDAVRNDLIDYIKTERNSYPPEDTFNLNLTEGTVRKPFSYYGRTVLNLWTPNGLRQDAFLKDVPLYSYYGLSRYYDLTKENFSAALWQKTQNALDRDMGEQDWATFYWFDGFQDRREAVVNANRHFAGLVGYVRLAQQIGDVQQETLGRALLAKAAILRLGMAHFPRYLYSTSLAELPSYWTDPFDDARQVVQLNQFGIRLADSNAYWTVPYWTGFDWDIGFASAHLIAYQDMTPEMSRLLKDRAKEDAKIYQEKFEALSPHWYAAYGEATLGIEHNLSHPIDSFQLFMAKALIQEDTADNLQKYVDIPWLQTGDLFYMHKLAETIKSHEGWQWSDEKTLIPGDANGDDKVDGVDYVIWLVNYFTNTSSGSSVGDFNNDGTVDGVDYVIWLNNYQP